MDDRQIIHFAPDKLPLDWKKIAQKVAGLEKGDHAERKMDIFDNAKQALLSASRPAGIVKTLSVQAFERIYMGEGHNDRPAPLGAIYPQADHLALYIVTLGQEISRTMGELTAAGQLTAAYMFDVIASETTEAAAEALQGCFQKRLAADGAYDPKAKMLRYSPGYCGWHISAQSKIFEALMPEHIGVRLGSGFIMDPLKSNSGVMVSGPGRIHWFRNDFPFCKTCQTHNCRERIKQLKSPQSEE